MQYSQPGSVAEYTHPNTSYFTAPCTLEYTPTNPVEYSAPYADPYIDYPVNYSQCIASPQTI